MSALTHDDPVLIARVQPLTLTRAIRGPFDYRLQADQREVGVGSVLRVPFGASRPLGVVVEVGSDSEMPLDRLAEPIAVLPGALPVDLVKLARWMAAEYCSTLARALGLVLAPGSRAPAHPREVLVAELTEAGQRALEAAAGLTEGQLSMLERLLRDGPAVAAELGTPRLRRLEKRGLVTLVPRAVRRHPGGAQSDTEHATALRLNADQRVALDQVLCAVRQRRGPAEDGAFLLHGVTGSGKTEVYLQAVRAALAAGRGAIVLVPEIALTPQTVARFRGRFGDVVAVLHSGLGDAARRAEWLRLRAGEARVCVGPRSAVFAPLPDIGLIVIDEEHDGSYKHEGDPRYDARTVALARAQEHCAVLLAGSATPRPESLLSLKRLRLRSRVDGRPLPGVEILDMRGAHHPLHPRTHDALCEVRRTGGKAIVLLNRRGWSNFLACRGCGRVPMCPNCDVALVLHRSRAAQPAAPVHGALECHHCGHRERAPERCRACGSVALARHGTGTERLEHDLRDALGDDQFPVFRLDADAIVRRGHLARVLADFRAADAGVLVGTQMVAKGHDFPDVTLGVVLDADGTLRFPDFRAEERTFALITQLAGRAGRGTASGRVVVQTLAPAARPILFAANHDADGFLSGELSRREALGYPPYGSLIRVICSCPDAADALGIADALRGEILPAPVTVLGPAPLFRLRGRARSQLLIKCAARPAAIQAVAVAIDRHAALASRKSVSIGVDVDPQ
ncbi:MAG: primosomal protein N' [Actinomycetota bacterium]|nr:primosomal protein N' [Actinomycetota bacterium]